MSKEIVEQIEGQPSEAWLDDVDSDLPSELAESQKTGTLPSNILKKKLMLRARDWAGGKDVKFKVALDDSLAEVFSKAADVLGKPLLPPAPRPPLDVLHIEMRGGGWILVTDLNEPLWVALLRGGKRHLAIEYKLVVKINSQWGLAPSAEATPRQLLAAFGMDAQEFTLYAVDGNEPLPVDTPLGIKRGDRFEAQKDGRYGSTVFLKEKVARGSQTIEDDVAAVNAAGGKARLLNPGGQIYVEACGLEIPVPPWGSKRAAILIAVPATYPSGGLDAFYLKLPMTHSSGSIPYQQSVIHVDGHDWMLISWHYHESRPWNSLHDDLESHIQHCRGFFLTRGVRQ
jgi:hypothetical protein